MIQSFDFELGGNKIPEVPYESVLIEIVCFEDELDGVVVTVKSRTFMLGG